MIDILTILTVCFLMGLFLTGFSCAFNADELVVLLCLFMWPMICIVATVIIVVAAPVMFGHWVGEHVKHWF